MLYVSFWAIPRRLSSKIRRFGTLYRFHLHRQVDAYENGTDRGSRNVGFCNSDAGELPKRNNTTIPQEIFNNIT